MKFLLMEKNINDYTSIPKYSYSTKYVLEFRRVVHYDQDRTDEKLLVENIRHDVKFL